MKIPFKISLEQQKDELARRVPPVLNIDLVVVNERSQYLLGKRRAGYYGVPEMDEQWLFPGGGMQWNETIEDAVQRKLLEELPGIEVSLQRVITANSDRGFDHRAYGVTIYYLLSYKSGEPKPNDELESFRWVTKDELLLLPRALWLHQSVVEEIDGLIRNI